MKRTARLALVLALPVLPSPARAADLYVDAANPNCPGSGTPLDPYCSIQDAILAAAGGDVVRVAPGTYLETIDFLGKAITVRSQDGPAATTLDGQGAGSVVTFAAGEGRASVLAGFRITGGSGTFLHSNPGGYNTYAGLGVFMRGASPRLQNNLIELNGLAADEVLGGGVYSDGGSPLLERNVIRDNGFATKGAGGYLKGGSPLLRRNEVTGHDGSLGAGFCLEGCAAAEVAGNDVHDNGTVFFGFVSGPGAGIAVQDCTGVLIRGNRFVRNKGTSGAGVSLERCSGRVEDNRFVANAAEFEGGGLAAWLATGLVVEKNAFRDNDAGSGAGAFVLGGSGVVIEECSFRGNTAAALFGALEVAGPHRVARCVVADNGLPPFEYGWGMLVDGGAVVEDCEIAANDVGVRVWGDATLRRTTITGSRYDAVEVLFGTLTLESAILFGNGTIAGGEIFLSGGAAAVSNSLVAGGFPGTNVLDADPLFVNAAASDYRLQSGSPCLDAGDPTDLSCGRDVSLRPRRVSAALSTWARVDMGAHEFSHVDLAVQQTGPRAYTISSTGTPGLATALYFGTRPGERCAAPAGTFFFDLQSPWTVVPWAALPSSVAFTVPLAPAWLGDLIVQQMAFGATPGTGNLSGATELRLP